MIIIISILTLLFGYVLGFITCTLLTVSKMDEERAIYDISREAGIGQITNDLSE